MLRPFVFTIVFFCLEFMPAQPKTVTIPLSETEAAPSIRLQTYRADITLTGTDRTDILLRYEPKAPTKEEDSSTTNMLRRIGGKEVSADIKAADGRVLIDFAQNNQNIQLTLEVPRKIALDVRQRFAGPITISEVDGSINIESNGGDISATGINGSVNASTNNGDITVELLSIPTPRVMLFYGIGGNVELRLPSDYEANLKLQASNGDILSDLSVSETDNPDQPKVKSQDGTFAYVAEGWTYAKLNSGGPRITVHVRYGDILLSRVNR